MKYEPRFISSDNKLLTLDGTVVSLASLETYDAEAVAHNQSVLPVKSVSCVRLPWTLVGLDEDSYNEELLASLREALKNAEEGNASCFIEPVVDSAVQSAEQKDALVASMKHAARRLKDCEVIIGFAVPIEVDGETFVEELSQKHSHYLFFSHENASFGGVSPVIY